MKRSILKVVLSTALISSMASGDDFSLGSQKVEFSKKLSLHALESLNSEDKFITVIVKTKEPITRDQKDMLYKNGAKSITYAGKNSFYLQASRDDIENLIEAIEDFDGVAILKLGNKISKDLQKVSVNDEIKVRVELFRDIGEDSFKKLLFENGIDFEKLKYMGEFKMAEVTIMGIDLDILASLSDVKYISKYHKIGLIKPFSTKLESNDIYTARDTRADKVWNETEFDGANIKVGIVEEGQVRRSHQEFQLGSVSKIKNRVGNGSLSQHSTHVAGIIDAKGENSYAKGIANGAFVYNYTYNDYYFASSLSVMYSHDKILLSNHSYGFTDKSDLGVYNSDASSEDSVIFSNPYITMFVAAGNDRGSSGYSETGIIKGAANAKNIITVGALNANSSDVAWYSSTGPTNDGRIKPELSVQGSSVYSTGNRNDDDYTYMSGTSMATPAATAVAALVMSEYKTLTKCENSGCDMRSDLLKSVLINTAVDRSSKGPDVYTGFGMIDAKGAVDVVKTLEDNYQKIKLDKVYRGSVKEYYFSKNIDGKFKVTVSWVDRAGNSANGKALVNDINIYLQNITTGDKFYPYVLSGTTITKGENHADNVEQIEVDNLPSGDYKLVVSGAGVQDEKSEFAVACSDAIFDRASSNITLKAKLKTKSFARVIMDYMY